MWLTGITWSELPPAGSALPPPGPKLVLVVDPALTESRWLEEDRTGLGAPLTEYLACGAVVVTSTFVCDMHKKAMTAQLKYDFWRQAAHESLFNTGQDSIGQSRPGSSSTESNLQMEQSRCMISCACNANGLEEPFKAGL